MKNLALLAFAAAILCAGCSGSSEPETKNDTPTTPSKSTDAEKLSDVGKTADAGKAADTASVKFADVQAIFSQSCAGCHSGAGAKQGIDLSSYEGVMKGGSEGKVIEAGDPGKSKLVLALRGQGGMQQMPKGMAPLAAEQIAKIEAWIKAGAKKD